MLRSAASDSLPPPVMLFGPFPTLQRLESVAGTEQKGDGGGGNDDSLLRAAGASNGCLAALLLRDSAALSAHRRWVMMLEAEKLRLPDEFAELLDGGEPRTATLREAGGERRPWDVEVVSDGEGHMYLERGWEQFARAHGMGLGNALVFSHDGGAVLTVKVFDVGMCGGNYQHDDANTGSNNGIDSSSNSSSSSEIDKHDAPMSQFTVTLKKCHSGVRQQQYLNVPPEFRSAHGYEDRSKVSLRMPGKSWPVNLKHSILLVTIAVVICITATPTTASGQWTQIPDLNDPEVLEIARWAVAEHASQADDGLQFNRVVSGMQQVVEGVKYNLSIDAVNGDGKECLYIAEVYDIPWLHNRTMNSFTLGPPSMGMCRLVDHPAPRPKSRGPQIRPCFLVLVTSWTLFLFI